MHVTLATFDHALTKLTYPSHGYTPGAFSNRDRLARARPILLFPATVNKEASENELPQIVASYE